MVDLGRDLEIGRAPKHNDLKRTTLYRNGHFEARKWGGALEASWEGGSEAENWKLRGRRQQRDLHYFEEDGVAILRLGSGGGLWRLPGRAALDRSREQKKQTASSESAIEALGRPIQGMV